MPLILIWTETTPATVKVKDETGAPLDHCRVEIAISRDELLVSDLDEILQGQIEPALRVLVRNTLAK